MSFNVKCILFRSNTLLPIKAFFTSNILYAVGQSEHTLSFETTVFQATQWLTFPSNVFSSKAMMCHAKWILVKQNIVFQFEVKSCHTKHSFPTQSDILSSKTLFSNVKRKRAKQSVPNNATFRNATSHLVYHNNDWQCKVKLFQSQQPLLIQRDMLFSSYITCCQAKQRFPILHHVFSSKAMTDTGKCEVFSSESTVLPIKALLFARQENLSFSRENIQRTSLFRAHHAKQSFFQGKPTSSRPNIENTRSSKATVFSNKTMIDIPKWRFFKQNHCFQWQVKACQTKQWSAMPSESLFKQQRVIHCEVKPCDATLCHTL